MANKMIRLSAEDTKDKESSKIPISDEFYRLLKNIPRAIHDDHVILYRG